MVIIHAAPLSSIVLPPSTISADHLPNIIIASRQGPAGGEERQQQLGVIVIVIVVAATAVVKLSNTTGRGEKKEKRRVNIAAALPGQPKRS